MRDEDLGNTAELILEGFEEVPDYYEEPIRPAKKPVEDEAAGEYVGENAEEYLGDAAEEFAGENEKVYLDDVNEEVYLDNASGEFSEDIEEYNEGGVERVPRKRVKKENEKTLRELLQNRPRKPVKKLDELEEISEDDFEEDIEDVVEGVVDKTVDEILADPKPEEVQEDDYDIEHVEGDDYDFDPLAEKEPAKEPPRREELRHEELGHEQSVRAEKKKTAYKEQPQYESTSTPNDNADVDTEYEDVESEYEEDPEFEENLEFKEEQAQEFKEDSEFEEDSEYEEGPKFEEESEYEEAPETEDESSRFNKPPIPDKPLATFDPDGDDLDEYDDDSEGGGSFTMVALVIGAAVVVGLLVTIGAFLYSKGIIFNKNKPNLDDQNQEAVVDTEVEDLQDETTDMTDPVIDETEDEVKPEEVPEEVEDVSEDDEEKDYEEIDYKNLVEVGLEAVSVLKDLKVKFVNTGTGKLVANIPFEVEVKYPDGTSKVWSDSDKDGIIYYTDLASGSYTLKVTKLSDEKYAEYKFPDSKTVDVKGEIAYNTVAIADEVLASTDVDENAEDTSRDGADSGGQAEVVTKTEEVTDTVAYVDSTKTDTYEEVDKAQIAYTVPNPGTEENTVTPPVDTTCAIAVERDSSELGVGSVTAIGLTLTGVEPGNVTVTTSDENVATAMLGSDGKITVSGVAAGSATITICKLDDATVNAHISITVIGSENTSDNNSDKLKFTDGAQVYVLENGTYREAVRADYDTFTQFFRLKSTYTGWQTIDGAKYYYNSEGNRVTGEQTIQGKKYTFDANGKLTSENGQATGTVHTGDGTLGIDVSKWNGNIDWTKVHDAGVSYAIIRIGYRGSSKGSLVDDSKFKTNIAGAQAAGIKVGVYFFSQAVNEVEAIEEASMVVDRLKGYSLSLPVYLDVEKSGGRGDTIDKDTRTAVCKAFCQTVQNAGYSAGVYSNKNWLTEKIDTSALSGYSIWVAHYAETCGYTGSYSIWQYTEKGTVDGIEGNVDLDRSYF